MSIKTKANILIATSVLSTAFLLASIPLIDERCLSCGERGDKHGLAVPLRKMSIIEWAFDCFTDGDLHTNGKCPTDYAIKKELNP